MLARWVRLVAELVALLTVADEPPHPPKAITVRQPSIQAAVCARIRQLVTCLVASALSEGTEFRHKGIFPEAAAEG